MNVAILIGVDIYDLPDSNLPGCKNDILLMNELLSSMGKFEDILVINKNEDGKMVKDKILQFVKKHKENGSSIEDFFFYFTGHGAIYENEFYYLLKDYAQNKIKQTSLENSELDTWIRDLNPKTTIKVIDACHSGKQYIKSVENPNLLMKESLKSINNCYFMSSSKSNQTSAANSIYSYFTISFLNAILKSSDGQIRYKEIMDYISDDFASKDKQTPYFVCQGDYTDVFGTVNNELKTKIQALFNSFISEYNSSNENKSSTKLVDLIKSDAEMYCTKAEMLEVFNELKRELEKYKLDNKDLKDIYEVKIEFLDKFPQELDLSFIGEWLEEDNNYFAETTYRKEKYTEVERVRNNKLGIIGIVPNSYYEDKKVTKFRDIVSGFNITESVPYKAISISYIPKYLNLKSFCIYNFFVFSKKYILFFTCDTTLKESSWEKTSIEFDDTWVTKRIVAKEKSRVFEYIKGIITRKGEDIVDSLVKEFKISDK